MKRKSLLVSAILAVLALAGALFLHRKFFAMEAGFSPVVYCATPVVDGGRVPVKDGVGIFEHVFRIENKGDTEVTLTEYLPSCNCVTISGAKSVIPPRSHMDVTATMRLGPENVKRRHVDVALVFDGDGKRPLKVRLSAAAAFGPYLSTKTLSYGPLYSGYPARKTLKVFWPDQGPRKDFVSRFETGRDVALSVTRIPGPPPMKRHDGEETFYASEERYEIALFPAKAGAGNTFVDFVLDDGTRHRVNIEFDVRSPGCFEPANYYWNPDGRQRRFVVEYVADPEDPPKGFDFSTTAFRVVKTRNEGGRHFIEFERTGIFTSGPSALLATLQSGRTVRMPVKAGLAPAREEK
ncbi:MAG: DUF1573 domain-containing protein [Puniceicoccales bacterium]|jgi:hypothetical protein|nr:DUF1573 domain-containing protein [Puniceicoccales bacterium]